MPDRSPRRNGNPSHERRAPERLRYRFNPNPEQLEPDLQERCADRLEEELNGVWAPPDTASYPAIAPVTFTNWHRHVLRELEAEERVGRFRGYKEASSYEIWDEADAEPDGEPRHCVCPGIEVAKVGAQTIWEAVKEACDAFQSAVDASHQTRPRDIADAVRPCVELYVALLKIRPFSIANDPIMYLALQAAYRRVGLEPLFFSPRIPTESGQAIDPDPERAEINLAFNRALARSLRPNIDDIDELVDFLATHARFR